MDVREVRDARSDGRRTMTVMCSRSHPFEHRPIQVDGEARMLVARTRRERLKYTKRVWRMALRPVMI